jgi:glycogen synthase
MFGKPTIACNVGGAPEVINHGVTGLLVKPGNHEELKGAIESLINDVQLRQAMGIAARANYERHFTEAAMRDAFLDMISNTP